MHVFDVLHALGMRHARLAAHCRDDLDHLCCLLFIADIEFSFNVCGAYIW